MTYFRIYFNGEYLPTRSDPQIIVNLCLPSIGRWYFSGDTIIGFSNNWTDVSYSVIILGFGLALHKNWDI